jgi:antitoxin component YwqK of YwqJK toxin-antitoxin module
MKRTIIISMMAALCMGNISLYAQSGIASSGELENSAESTPYFTDEKVVSTRSNSAYEGRYEDMRIKDRGRFRYGLPDGEWKGWFSNGTPMFIRNYNADKYLRIRQEVKKHPRQVFTPLAKAAQSDPAEIKRATSSVGSFRDLHESTTDTRIYQPPFNTCLHHGLYMNFYPNGSVKDSGYYKNGLREGHWEEWTENGSTRMSGGYHHGKRSGTWAYYDAGGKLRSLTSYNRKGEIYHQKFYE